MSAIGGHHHPQIRRGFTLIEILVTLTVIAALSVVIIPAFQDDAQLRVMAAAAVLASDIEFAQVQSISQPNDRIIVQFDTANSRYWLAYADDPNSPLLRPDTGEPYLVEFGVDRGRAADDVSIWLVDVEDDRLSFDANGGMQDFTALPQIILGRNSQYRTLSVAASTGTITETEGAPEGWSPPTE